LSPEARKQAEAFIAGRKKQEARAKAREKMTPEQAEADIAKEQAEDDAEYLASLSPEERKKEEAFIAERNKRQAREKARKKMTPEQAEKDIAQEEAEYQAENHAKFLASLSPEEREQADVPAEKAPAQEEAEVMLPEGEVLDQEEAEDHAQGAAENDSE